MIQIKKEDELSREQNTKQEIADLNSQVSNCAFQSIHSHTRLEQQNRVLRMEMSQHKGGRKGGRGKLWAEIGSEVEVR